MEKLEVSKWNDDSRDEIKGVSLSRGNQCLNISSQGNLGLYFSLKDCGNDNTFVIGKDNREVFNAFDNLYNSVMHSNVVEIARGTGLVEDIGIKFKSDDRESDVAPCLEIQKSGDAYLLMIDDPTPQGQMDCLKDFGLDRPPLIVRLKNSGSLYTPFNVLFMQLFHSLMDIDTDAHQIDIDEYLIDRQLEEGKPLQKILCPEKKSA